MYTVPGENFEVYILHNKIVNCNEIKYNCDGTASIVFLIILENFHKNVENFTFNFEDWKLQFLAVCFQLKFN